MHDLNHIASTWAEAISSDLSGLTSKQIAISGPEVAEGPLERVLGYKGDALHVGCSVDGAEHPDLGFVAPLGGARALAAAQLGQEPKDLGAGALEGEAAEAYKNVMDLFVGILSRVFDEEASLPATSMGAITPIELPVGETGTPTPGTYRRARFTIGIDGAAAEHVDLLIPVDLAANWFGAAATGPDPQQDDVHIALIDAQLVDREEVETLAERVGHKIVPIDVAEIGPDIVEDLAEAGALILGWDLGGLAGLDVLESLHREPRLAELRIALASEAPTPAMVAAALRWGAFTVLCKPYDPREIRERLLDASP